MSSMFYIRFGSFSAEVWFREDSLTGVLLTRVGLQQPKILFLEPALFFRAPDGIATKNIHTTTEPAILFNASGEAESA
jgi:hypothetical protein